MRQRMEAAGVPGGAIAIVRDGQLDFSAGVGVKRHDRSDPVGPDTLFRVASLTKVLTAIAVMSLVDGGRLDLSRPITDYVPWFAVRPPYDASAITTQELLIHRAALPNGAPPNCPTGPGAIRDYFRENNPLLLWAPPGRYYNYSNYNYALVGLVAETVDGRPYAEMMRERVFEPAGMTTATFDTAAAQAADHTVGHTLSSTGTVTATYEPTSYDCGHTYPAGGAFASVRDYARLAEVLLGNGGGVLSPESNQALQSPQVWTRNHRDSYSGYGLIVTKYKGIDVVVHEGGLPGFLTYLMLVPGRRDSVIVFLNGRGSGLNAFTFAQRALDILYDLSGVPPADYSTPPWMWTAYEGTYRDPNRWGTVRVQLRGDRLWGDFVDLGWSGPFTQLADDRFSISPPGAALTPIFHRAENQAKAEAIVFRRCYELGFLHFVTTTQKRQKTALRNDFCCSDSLNDKIISVA